MLRAQVWATQRANADRAARWGGARASRDHRSAGEQPAERPGGGDDELVMVWPYWEKGYGDVIANTLLPFGELLREGRMPRHLSLAGMRHATLLPALRAATSTLCASERDNPPLLPRCDSACWGAVRICAPEFFESTRSSWHSTVALDAAAALMPPPVQTMPRDPLAAIQAAYHAASTADGVAAEVGTDGSTPPSSTRSDKAALTSHATELRVLFAARHGRRLLANADELAAACDGRIVLAGDASTPRTVSRCSVLPASTPQADKTAALRRVHVFVTVWGGDTVHALHMRRGSGVIELRSSGFAAGAPWSWLELHKRWTTRHSGDERRPPLHFYPVPLPTNASIMRREEQACMQRNRARQKRWLAQDELRRGLLRNDSSARGDSKRRARGGRMPNEEWLCYWNADLHVHMEYLMPALIRHALATATGASPSAAVSQPPARGRMRVSSRALPPSTTGALARNSVAAHAALRDSAMASRLADAALLTIGRTAGDSAGASGGATKGGKAKGSWRHAAKRAREGTRS